METVNPALDFAESLKPVDDTPSANTQLHRNLKKNHEKRENSGITRAKVAQSFPLPQSPWLALTMLVPVVTTVEQNLEENIDDDDMQMS